ncbi:S24 family peptidase [Romboutsia sp. MSSM.1001216sp_RTP31141st1_G3_RTP31141_220114]|uniref:helix-turn-helix domain-containing protein n=1 Tax=unclassified Romboutsia TaxID=2626894 RepID=UPI0031B573F0
MKENNFPRNLKRIRQLYKLSQEELGSKINVSKQTISKYEKGLTEPNFHTLIELSKLLDCSLDELVFGNINSISKNPISLKLIIENKIDILKNELNFAINDYFEYEEDNGLIEYAEELTYEINPKSKLSSSSLSNNSNIVDFLDKLKSKRSKQLIDCESNDFINEFIPKINLLGQVSAGCPNLACEDRNSFVKVPNSLLCPSKDYFVLKVSGDSMDKIYHPNELLLIEKTNVANNGDMVVALIGTDECTLKEYEKIDDIIYLTPHSTNPAHKIQEYDTNKVPCHIIGVVKNILKGAIFED